MSAPKLNRFTTNSTTGNRPVSGLGYQPTYLRFIVSGKTSASETGARFSLGYTDGTVHGCNSTEGSSTPPAYTDRVINLVTPSGNIVASLVSFDVDGFTLNFSSTVSGYRVHVECYQ